MNALWTINLVVWGLVLVVSAIGAATAAFRRGKARRGDPMRLATFLVASLFIGHAARWLAWPDNLQLWKALYVVGAATAIYILRLMASYGRGSRLTSEEG